MRYLPHTPEDLAEMLGAVGVQSLDDLFKAIPPEGRRQTPLDLPAPHTEWELADHLGRLAAQGGGDWRVFLNAGSSDHLIPAVVPSLAGRSEFLTSYTPYQPEMSQGTLQAIFEFQTLVSRLTGLPVTNASLYDGATAMAESALMAQRVTGRTAVVVSELVHPHWRQVLATYLAAWPEVELATLPAGTEGRTLYTALQAVENPAVLIMQSPNFFGVIEDLPRAAESIHRVGGLLAAGFSEALALGLMKSPGAQGADIVFGEGQSLGLDQGFGGPTLGLMSAKLEHVRQMPGRLVGQTTDKDGQRGFVLTLATREQHIRRSRAVSNICSNAGHAALTAAVFMAAIGGTGFRELAQVNLDRAEYLKAGLVSAGWRPVSEAPTFNEFAMIPPRAGCFPDKYEALKAKKILAGLSLARWYPEFGDAWLFGVTETKTKADIDAFIAEVK